MSLRIALLGSGLATRLHSKTLASIAPDVGRWYASRDAARAAHTCERFHGAGHFPSYAAAVEAPEIDAVLVALPPSMHLEWTLRALTAGKHVIVEKPPFFRAEDVDTVAAAARQAGRQVLVAENYYYKPLAGYLRRVVARGEIGAVHSIDLNARKGQVTGNWRDDPAIAGGGALFEGGIHWISLLANIGLTATRIRAVFPDGRPERSANVTIEYAEGARATLAFSWDAPGLVNGVRLSRMYGSAGAVYFETNGLFVGIVGRGWPRFSVSGVVDLAGYRGMMTDFLAAIRENRPPAYGLALARRDLQLIHEAYASAA